MSCYGCMNYVETIDFVDGIGITKRYCKRYKIKSLDGKDITEPCDNFKVAHDIKRKKGKDFYD